MPAFAGMTTLVVSVLEELPMISADLGARLEDFVSKLVESGRYGSKSEVLREGVRLVEEREKRLALLDAALERGLADIDAGRTHALDDVADELARRYGAGENKPA
jgi:antitoxin ParD1/3/4